MSEAQAETTRRPDPADPMKQFRDLRDAYLDIWSKSLIDAVNTDGYAQASGAAVNSYLSVAAPYKEAAEQTMLRTLQQLNMPSSVDFADLAGRITNIEMLLDNLDAKLDGIQRLLTVLPAAANAAPLESTPTGPDTSDASAEFDEEPAESTSASPLIASTSANVKSKVAASEVAESEVAETKTAEPQTAESPSSRKAATLHKTVAFKPAGKFTRKIAAIPLKRIARKGTE